MEISNEKIKYYTKRLILARMRVLCNNGFYGLLLMKVKLAVDTECETAATDGKKIYFGMDFLENLSDNELDFVLMHEILHIALFHCLRDGDRDPYAFNIACDIVVNSNILKSNNMDKNTITLAKYGEGMHLAPNGQEGYKYTAEEVYEMLPASLKKQKVKGKPSDITGSDGEPSDGDDKPDNAHGGFDNHSKWKDIEGTEEEEREKEEWKRRIADAAEIIEVRNASHTFGGVPLFAQRILKELKNPQTDWRTMLNEFIEKIFADDYSFMPPDRRFCESPFFLPDLNSVELDGEVKNILFMIDTSGSISDTMIAAAYSEIKGAIDQFEGHLKGWVAFCEVFVKGPYEFEKFDDLTDLKIKGGGGNDFTGNFTYLLNKMENSPPACIVFITDGYDTFPQESAAKGIPVLWLINNEDVVPPWGKVARISI